MWIFLQAGFWNKELHSLNHCQIYLKIMFVSDICTGMGTTIDQRKWEGSATGHP